VITAPGCGSISAMNPPFFFFKDSLIYLRERENARVRMSGGGAEGERESQAGSMPSAEPDTGLDLTKLRS